MAEQAGSPTPPTPKKWMIAAWPGMGNVAVIAAGYLINALKLRPVAELGTPGLFDVKDVDVEGGVITPPRAPRNLVFRGPLVKEMLDLTVFMGEAQPEHGALAFAHGLLEHTAEYGIERVFTFASMASQMHPTDSSRVHGAATSQDLLADLRRAEVQVMENGQIGGLNGVVLGAASQRGLPGLCLLGEIPFFSANVGNPKAARAVLDAFGVMAGIEIDLEELARHAEVVDRALVRMLEQMEAEDEEGDEDEGDEGAESAEGEEEGAGKGDSAARARIEKLFEEAAKDRAKAMLLKQELDRQGLFKQYEDRFLALFRRAE